MLEKIKEILFPKTVKRIRFGGFRIFQIGGRFRKNDGDKEDKINNKDKERPYCT